MKNKTIHFFTNSVLTLLLIWCVGFVTIKAQQTPDVQVELSLFPVLSEAQTLSLAQLGVDTRGAGNRLFNIIIEITFNK